MAIDGMIRNGDDVGVLLLRNARAKVVQGQDVVAHDARGLAHPQGRGEPGNPVPLKLGPAALDMMPEGVHPAAAFLVGGRVVHPREFFPHHGREHVAVITAVGILHRAHGRESAPPTVRRNAFG